MKPPQFFFSVHKLLCCKLELAAGVTFGNGLWKLNVSILEDEEVWESLFLVCGV